LRFAQGKKEVEEHGKKARILETTMDKERIWEGDMTPPFWGWGTQT